MTRELISAGNCPLSGRHDEGKREMGSLYLKSISRARIDSGMSEMPEGSTIKQRRTMGYGVRVRKLRYLARISLRLFAALFGLGLLSYLVFRAGPGGVWKQVQAVGWGLVLIIILGGFGQFIKAWAWRQTFVCDISGLSWSRSVGVQLVSDAAGQLGLAGKLIGEGLRVSLVGSVVPLPRRISAAAIDAGMHTLTAAFVTVLGIIATLLLANLSGRCRVDALLLAVLLMALVALATVAVASRWPLMGNAARALARVPLLQNWVSTKQPIIDSAEHNLLTFYREAPAAFWVNLTLNFLSHALAVLEVYLILLLMGAHIAVVSALALEGLTKVINLVGVFNPGNLGTYEGGNMLIAKFLGVPGTAGLALALCRRARIFFWAGVGAMCMIAVKRPNGHSTSQSDAASAP